MTASAPADRSLYLSVFLWLIIVAAEIREAEAAAKVEVEPAEAVLPSGPNGRTRIPESLRPNGGRLRPKPIPRTPGATPV